MIYGYDFEFGFGFKTGINFASAVYSDVNNLNKIPGYMDLFLNMKYEIFPDFYLTLALENLINRNNQLYLGYKEKPFDIIGGIIYDW